MGILIRVLRGFAYVWSAMAFIFIGLCLIMVWINGGFSRVQEVMSPYNVVNFILTIMTLSPGIGAFWLAEKLERENASETTQSRVKAAGALSVIVVLAFVVIIAVGMVVRSELKPASSTHDNARAGGELYPHFHGNEFSFVGSYYGQHVYVRPAETVHLQNGVFVADTFIATEESAFLVYDRSTNKTAMATTTDAVLDIRAQDFIVLHPDSLAQAALQVHESQESANGQIRSGKTRQWLYVALTPELIAVYVPVIETEQEESKLKVIRMLFVKEQRCQLYVDPGQRRFAPVNTDMLLNPQEEVVYRPMREGEMEDKVCRMIQGYEAP